MPDVDLQKFASRCAINPPGSYEGPAIASAASITLSHPVHKITGTTTITTMNPPYPGFCGHVTLVCVNGGGVGAGGNISKAAAFTIGVAFQFYYDGTMWYPPS